MKTNIKKNRIAWVSSSILMALVVVGCVYLDKVNVNQGTEENPIIGQKLEKLQLLLLMLILTVQKIKRKNFLWQSWFRKVGMHVRIQL